MAYEVEARQGSCSHACRLEKIIPQVSKGGSMMNTTTLQGPYVFISYPRVEELLVRQLYFGDSTGASLYLFTL
jgi:hypothetical protein